MTAPPPQVVDQLLTTEVADRLTLREARALFELVALLLWWRRTATAAAGSTSGAAGARVVELARFAPPVPAELDQMLAAAAAAAAATLDCEGSDAAVYCEMVHDFVRSGRSRREAVERRLRWLFAAHPP